jgi:hypothetical protein
MSREEYAGIINASSRFRKKLDGLSHRHMDVFSNKQGGRPREGTHHQLTQTFIMAYTTCSQVTDEPDTIILDDHEFSQGFVG